MYRYHCRAMSGFLWGVYIQCDCWMLGFRKDCQISFQNNFHQSTLAAAVHKSSLFPACVCSHLLIYDFLSLPTPRPFNNMKIVKCEDSKKLFCIFLLPRKAKQCESLGLSPVDYQQFVFSACFSNECVLSFSCCLALLSYVF